MVYGVPVWGFAALWAALAAALTVRAARQRLPFSLTWWSFTFPVGTCVDRAPPRWPRIPGRTRSAAAAVALYLGLVAAWLMVGVRTARGAWRGELLRPAAVAGNHADEVGRSPRRPSDEGRPGLA